MSYENTIERPLMSEINSGVYYESVSDSSFPIMNYYYNRYGKFPKQVRSYIIDNVKPLDDLKQAGFKFLTGRSSTRMEGIQPFLEVYLKEYSDDTLPAYAVVWYENKNDDDEEDDDTTGISEQPKLKENYLSGESSNEPILNKISFDKNHLGELANMTKPVSVSVLTVTLYFDDYIKVENLLLAFTKYHTKQKKGNAIHLITENYNGTLNTTKFPVNIQPLDIAKNYGSKFIDVYNRVMDKLNTDKEKGLVLFHGIPGSGKTTLLRHIASKLNKEVIFVPPYMVDAISSPKFVPFLLDHRNSVLIIEDAERVLVNRDSHESSSQGVSNILNITDGILGDCLNIQIIATFNTDRKKIDEALLRKGRCIAEYHFDKLSIEESNELFKHLEIDYTTSEPLTLTEIYNIREISPSVQSVRQQIGFIKQ